MKKTAVISIMSAAALLFTGCGAKSGVQRENDEDDVTLPEFAKAVANLSVISADYLTYYCVSALLKDPEKHTYDEAYTTSNKQDRTVIDAADKKDAAAVKELFRKTDDPELDRKINEFIGFIDGEIISTGKPFSGYNGFVRDEAGNIFREIGGIRENIQTDTGKTYYICFQSRYEPDKSPDTAVMTRLLIADKDGNGRYEINV
ncbi:MAG: DUF5104 domain-containing protein [Oscillospiraceae bacterium]|nr:DUF5104 domain-containing protein [Oscillospiraceae bacterium]